MHIDGVDLNRNYDINWIFGDALHQETESCNSFYNDDYDYLIRNSEYSRDRIRNYIDIISSNFKDTTWYNCLLYTSDAADE